MKSVLSAAALLCLVTAAFAADAIVPYPAGYRDWYHVKSMVIQEGNSLFAAGDPGKPVVDGTAATACFACHETQKAHGYVFSTLRGGG